MAELSSNHSVPPALASCILTRETTDPITIIHLLLGSTAHVMDVMAVMVVMNEMSYLLFM